MLDCKGSQEKLHKRQFASVMVTAKQKKLGLQRITGGTTYKTADSCCDADRQTEQVRTSKGHRRNYIDVRLLL